MLPTSTSTRTPSPIRDHVDRAVLVDGHYHAAVMHGHDRDEPTLTACLRADDHDRAPGVGGALVAYRAQEQLGEAAAAA